MVSVEPLKYLLLSGEGIFRGDSKETALLIEKEKLFGLKSLMQFGSSGLLAYRNVPESVSPFLQILGIGVEENAAEEESAFNERYGKLSIHVETNSQRFAESSTKLLKYGSKAHSISVFSIQNSKEELVHHIVNRCNEFLQLSEPDKPSKINVLMIHLIPEESSGHEVPSSKSLSPADILLTFNEVITYFMHNPSDSSPTYPLPPIDYGKPLPPSSELVNELFIKQDALAAKPPPPPPHSLWISLVGSGWEVKPLSREEYLIKPSYHFSFDRDIYKQLSNKRLGFVHCCPGHTRIDEQTEFCEESFEHGSWKTIRAEQLLSEIAYRLHCTPKFGA
ncbi:uncharacterized protein MONOS_12818 [Monocercomonoides exilis]|uniref:uncharacterized protein n=1 Tax=Monocercomonoides exilis TaxID=2049356 RepID=UPI00355AC2C8|nr:hypothetical protein MONOS_12818 [Monocercomonoides exilis]|eukprot:MONOS_12818.1-p1 / transcript=MONOS_12818.1 / gene=MONOS_12818 / organism=Monocercomonoides_exilis_PA203 / gene_product=unspecified product / transcript_product=unspecified product / location=Mono_scaffold00738:4283-5544(+) / protein_length=335 / sequence_SO=supercontig / SO=protein_coding / is_pseudo=false